MRLSRRFAWPKLILYFVVAVSLAAWLVVPKISAEKYREPMRIALENALGRKVEFSALQFRLLPLPGFTLTNLTVWEDPSIGAEPIAYVGAVHALPRFSSLFTGALALSSVDLEGASITLTRIEPSNPGADSGVRWNFSSMMRPARAANFPSVHMLSGRVNFKFGDAKSIFYLLHTDVDLWPPSSSSAPWTIRVRAQPARTDRPARGFGYFSAGGEWRQIDNAVTLDVILEQSELGDMLTLFEGHESGVLGEIHGDAHLAGPMSRVGIRGRLTVENVHGWNESPPGGNALPVWLSGDVDARGQILDVRATLAQSQSPVDVRYRVADYLGRPQWGVTALFSQMPVKPLVAIARNLGLRIPPGMEISGVADGAASYAMPLGALRLDGQIAISNLTVTTTGSPTLRLDPATLRLEGRSVALGPAIMSNASGEVATVGIGYAMDTGKTTASVSTSGMSIAGLRRQISAAGLPVLGQATSGSWSGALAWSDGWTGEIRITGADIPFEAFSQPLRVRTADVSIAGPAIAIKHMEVAAAGIEASGDYRYEPGAVRPHRFHLNLVRADASALEKLFSPALRRGSFLNYAFNFGRPPQPEWLTAMRADGVVQAAELDFGDAAAVKKLRARLLWDGYIVRLADVQATAASGKFSGGVIVDLSQREPQYRIPGSIAALPLRSGKVDVQGEAATYGFGLDLLTNLHATGSFRGRALELGAAEAWDTASGCFDWAWSPRNSRLKLNQLVLTSAGETWLGTAETRGDGNLMLNVSDGEKKLQTSEALFSAVPAPPAP
jgi:hypothetical protein